MEHNCNVKNCREGNILHFLHASDKLVVCNSLFPKIRPTPILPISLRKLLSNYW